MPVKFVGDIVVADKDCVVEDALTLVELMQSNPDAGIDLGCCTHLHTAVLQVLLAARTQIVVMPQETFLARWLPQMLLGPDTGVKRI